MKEGLVRDDSFDKDSKEQLDADKPSFSRHFLLVVTTVTHHA